MLTRHLDKFAGMNGRWNLILFGTPEWAAVSPERYAQGVKAGRPHAVPPDPQKYAELVERVIEHYDRYVAVYEVWNEPDLQQFWRGTPEEYERFVAYITDVIRRKAPGKLVITGGLAHLVIPRLPLAAQGDLVALHPYIGEGSAWDVPIGQFQGELYALGKGVELYPNESGFVYQPGEWFRGPWTPRRQATALSTAMARALHGDTAKLTVFLAGGDRHYSGIYDEHGEPRPAALVFEDYVRPGQRGARRLDVAVVPADGDVPLQGVYAAAAVHEDGSVTIILNPAESPVHQRTVRVLVPPTGVALGAPSVGRFAPATEGGGTLEVQVQGRTVIEMPLLP